MCSESVKPETHWDVKHFHVYVLYMIFKSVNELKQ